jgi:hypothetical protein
LADRGKSAARVDRQQAFLLTAALAFALARRNSAHACNFHQAGGTGFRAIADPFYEGVAIFSGIDYPF